jgi:lipid II:glycine glycyltransferase (peptidoglycan interpeptide bridge formation enzyme)
MTTHSTQASMNALQNHPMTAAAWDAFVTAHPDGHLLQTSDWGQFKAEFGWQAQIVALSNAAGQIVCGAQVLFRRLHRLIPSIVPLSIAYIPGGPLFADPSTDKALWQAINRAAFRHGALWLKVEPCDWYAPRPGLADRLRSQGLQPAPQTIQPPRTVVLDLTGSDDDILKRMNQSTRYKAKLGPKKEIEVRCGTVADLASFNALMAVTGARDAFGVHDPNYYRRAFEHFAAGDRCALILASYQGQDLAGVMVFRQGNQAYYLYGASSNAERNRMPTFIAQWAAIRWARDHGALFYDMWGIPDADEAILESDFETRSDGLWGVYGFKRGWGGRIVRSVGAWDRVYNLPVYELYKRLLKRRKTTAVE